MELNNREIAVLVWTAILIGSVAVRADFFGTLGCLVHAFFQRLIIIVLSAASLWIAMCVWLLAAVGVWDWDNSKTTLIWAATFAFVTVFDMNRIREDRTFFGKTVRDVVSATAIVTFIADLYSFPLIVEILLVPFLMSVTAMYVMANGSPKYIQVRLLLGWLLALVGFSYCG